MEGTEAKPTELEAVSEFSKHFKTVMKEREKEKTVETKTKTETKTETPVVEEKVVEEPEEEEDDVMGEEQTSPLDWAAFSACCRVRSRRIWTRSRTAEERIA